MPENDHGVILLRLARSAIVEHFAAGLQFIEPLAEAEGWLSVPSATFVTLMQHGELRGCMGSLAASRPLNVDVRENALAAAFHDPRFPPLQADELDDTTVEVSLLSPLQPLQFGSEQEALVQLQPNVDGVVFECGHFRSTFLPQVWEQLPNPKQFLGQLKRKAGLPSEFWSDEVKLSRYSVTKWKEEV